jgi:hypothetical protein
MRNEAKSFNLLNGFILFLFPLTLIFYRYG